MANLLQRIRPMRRTKLSTVPTVLPAGLTNQEANQRFEAATAAIQAARRQNEAIPQDLNLTDFDFEDDKARLRPISAERSTLNIGEEQAAMARLIYQLVVGRTMGEDSQKALQSLSVPTSVNPNNGVAQGYSYLAEVIEQGLNKQFGSLAELAGAFGYALYCQHIAQTATRTHLEVPVLKAATRLPETTSVGVMRKNLAVIVGLGAVSLLLVLAIIGLTSNPELFNNLVSPKTSNILAAGATATADTNATANAIQPYPAFTPFGNDVGAIQHSFDLNQTGQPDQPNLQSLTPGHAALWNVPSFSVVGSQWKNGTLGIAFSDGTYSLYAHGGKSYVGDDGTSKETFGALLTHNSALSDDKIAACWSPDGSHYVAITTDQQLIWQEMRNGQANGAAKAVKLPFNLTDNPPNRSNIGNICGSFFNWSPNSRRLLLSSGNFNNTEHWLFSTDGLVQLQTIVPQSSNYMRGANSPTVIWSPDGTRLGLLGWIANGNQVSSNADNLSIYDTITGQLQTNLMLNSALVTNPANSGTQAVNWLPDNSLVRLVATQVSSNSNVYSNTLETFQLPDSNNQPKSVTLSLQGQTPLGLSYSWSGRSVAWSADYTQVAIPFALTQSNTNGSVNAPTEIRIYQRETTTSQFSLLTAIPTGTNPPDYLSWSNDGPDTLLGGSRDGQLRLWPISVLPKQPQTAVNSILLEHQPGSVLDASVRGTPILVWSPDGQSLMQVEGGTLQLKNANNGLMSLQSSTSPTVTLLAGFGNFNNRVSSSAWSADGKFFASTVFVPPANSNNNGNRNVSAALGVWKISDTSINLYGLIKLDVPSYRFDSHDWAFDSQKSIIYLYYGNGRLAYDLTKPLPPLVEQNPSTFEAAGQFGDNTTPLDSNTILGWSHQTDVIVFGAGQNYTIAWLHQNSATVRPNLPINFSTDPGVVKVVFSVDDKLVAFATKTGSVYIFGTSDGKILATISAAMGTITDLAFAPDNQTLATTGIDRTVKIWQATSDNSHWKLAEILGGHNSAISSLAFSPNGTFLQSSDYSGGTLVWRVK